MSEYTTPNNIRKIPFSFEGPFDIAFITIAEKLNPLFKKLNFTPNGITTLSVIFKLITLYSFYYNKYYISAISLLLAYLFDCCDGSYARKYNMESVFGDLYDHINDLLFGLTLFFLIIFKDIPKKIKYSFLTMLFVLVIGFIFYVMCSESYINENKIKKFSSLDLFNFFKGNTKQCLKISKYLSSGTLIIFIVIFMITLKLLI